ncbi:MAG: RES family NAD+ phosphorylase [Gammaproteobacteria bacterium]|nr:RES family NAD+ phosphorylase [Gammaproteobacteria bacterium]
MAKPRQRNLEGKKQYRIIPSRFPPIPLFERLVDPDELEIAYAIESLTNDRLQAEAGNLHLLDKSDWVTGPGASVVMAAFTHVGQPSRFGDGSYGVYYAGLSEETAIRETVFHTERRLRETAEPAINVEMRCYVGTITLSLDDIRGAAYAEYRDPDLATWPRCQAFAVQRRQIGAHGLLYRSARHDDGQCVAAFRTRAISRPRQGKHFQYCWDGERVVQYREVRAVHQL